MSPSLEVSVYAISTLNYGKLQLCSGVRPCPTMLNRRRYRHQAYSIWCGQSRVIELRLLRTQRSTDNVPPPLSHLLSQSDDTHLQSESVQGWPLPFRNNLAVRLCPVAQLTSAPSVSDAPLCTGGTSQCGDPDYTLGGKVRCGLITNKCSYSTARRS